MKLFLLLPTLFLSGLLFSQKVTNLKTIQPHAEYENILIKKLDTDENSTSFVIWIKEDVKSHKHETHSEIISVIEGSGIMTIGKTSFEINSGDYFRIPENTFHSLKVNSKKPMKVLSIQSPEFLGKDRIFEQ
ncbi:MAG: cupin domain-containing protein [Vicingaceae bacterium]